MRILLLGFTILLVSCAATTNYYPETVQSWKGGNANALVKRWGTPDERLNGPKGSAVLVYKTQTMRNYNAPASPSIGVSVAPDGRPIMTTATNVNNTWNRNGVSLTCVTAFQVNAKGTILSSVSKGTGCYGSQQFVSRMGNPDNQPITKTST
jgi:hypothetical protein